MQPMVAVVIVAAVASLFCWIASLVTRDYSWVDRSWSILPVIYVAIFAAWTHFRDQRLAVMTFIVLAWGVRLTFNLARKGGYSGLEDYRWEVLRSRMTKAQFQLFNFFFIVIYQNVILVAITLPAYTAYQHRSDSITASFIIVSSVFLLCTAGEYEGDQEQWMFQKAKAAEIAEGRTPTAQFCEQGMFRYSRHPAYFFELAQWWLFFALGAMAAGSPWQWTVIGVVLLTGLFIGSTRFTESITLARYPEYAQYQRRTSAIVPWPARRTGGAVPKTLSQ